MRRQKPLEPAIPEHLRVVRTRPLSAPTNYVPISQSFSARFDTNIKSLPHVYFGVQYKQWSADVARVITAHEAGFRMVNGPSFFDRAVYENGGAKLDHGSAVVLAVRAA